MKKINKARCPKCGTELRLNNPSKKRKPIHEDVETIELTPLMIVLIAIALTFLLIIGAAGIWMEIGDPPFEPDEWDEISDEYWDKDGNLSYGDTVHSWSVNDNFDFWKNSFSYLKDGRMMERD